MWVVTRPPPGARPLPSTIRSSPSISTVDAVDAQHVCGRREAIGFLHAQFAAGRASASCLRQRMRPPQGSDIRRSSTARAPPALRRRAARCRARADLRPLSPPSLRVSTAPRSTHPSRAASRTGRCATGLSSRRRARSRSPARSARQQAGTLPMTDRPAPATAAPSSSGWPCQRMRRPCSPSGSTRTCAPKCVSIFSVWSRLASFSITMVSPGAASPASSTADLSCADATGGGTRSESDRARPQASAAAGRRRAFRAPARRSDSSGSSTRFIGRLRSEPSPSNTAVIGQPATAPMTRRQPVPELPKSSGACRLRKSARHPRRAPTRRPRPSVRPARRARCITLAVLMHVLAFEQARDSGFTDRHRRQDQRAMRNRLVAGHPDAPGQCWRSSRVSGMAGRKVAQGGRSGRGRLPS